MTYGQGHFFLQSMGKFARQFAVSREVTHTITNTIVLSLT